jgi:hypothetical protein
MGKKKPVSKILMKSSDYSGLLSFVIELLENARRTSARTVNAILTATYWDIGRRIVEFEQRGSSRAAYGEQLLQRLASDLTRQFGRGFSHDNLQRMRLFYTSWPPDRIYATLSRKSGSTSEVSKNATSSRDFDGVHQTKSGEFDSGGIPHALSAELQTKSAQFTLQQLSVAVPLPWSHYVRLLSVKSHEARAFYEAEAIRGGWSVRQLRASAVGANYL